MNWKRIHKIQDRIEYFDQQIQNLKDLAIAINDDHEFIHIYIEHENHGKSMDQPQFPFMLPMDRTGMQTRKKEPDFDPFHMSLKDDWAMDFIASMIQALQQQQERLKSKLKEEQNVMYRVYVEGIGNVEQTENNGIARKAFDSFKDMSKEDFGRVGGRNVYLYKGNETLASHEPQIKGDHHE